jgi:cobalt-zinc-cadmium efflux system protein
VLVSPDADCHAKRRELERVLEERFDLTHTTLQVDHAGNGEAIHLGTAERRIGPL